MNSENPETGQSFAGLVRERLASIEARMFFGVRQKQLLKEFAEEGHVVTIQTFRSTLVRAKALRHAEPASQGSTRGQISRPLVSQVAVADSVAVAFKPTDQISASEAQPSQMPPVQKAVADRAARALDFDKVMAEAYKTHSLLGNLKPVKP